MREVNSFYLLPSVPLASFGLVTLTTNDLLVGVPLMIIPAYPAEANDLWKNS